MFETVSPTLHVANSFMRCNLASNRHQLLAFEWKKSGVGMIPRSKPWNQVFWGASSRCRSSTWTIAWEHGRRMEMIIFGTLEDTCTMYKWQHFECIIVDIYGFGCPSINNSSFFFAVQLYSLSQSTYRRNAIVRTCVYYQSLTSPFKCPFWGLFSVFRGVFLAVLLSMIIWLG